MADKFYAEGRKKDTGELVYNSLSMAQWAHFCSCLFSAADNYSAVVIKKSFQGKALKKQTMHFFVTVPVISFDDSHEILCTKAKISTSC